MTDVRFTIAVPTTGRPTLSRTLRSIIDAGLDPADEVVVMGDGPQKEAVDIVNFYRQFFPIVYGETPNLGHVGHPIRNHVMDMAKGTHFLTIDDDDEYTAGALARMRATIGLNPGRVHIFKMRGAAPRHCYGYCWRSKDVVCGNVGTPMIVAPNVKERLGRWGERYIGDFDFYTSTIEKQEGKLDSVVWVDDVIANIY